jgi:hypothetical protein
VRAGQTLVAVEGTLAGTWAALAPLERRAVEALATVASGRGVAMVVGVVALAALVFAVAAAAATAGGRVAETDGEAGQQQVCLACPGLALPRQPRAARQPVVTVTVRVMWTACALKTRVSLPALHTCAFPPRLPFSELPYFLSASLPWPHPPCLLTCSLAAVSDVRTRDGRNQECTHSCTFADTFNSRPDTLAAICMQGMRTAPIQ